MRITGSLRVWVGGGELPRHSSPDPATIAELHAEVVSQVGGFGLASDLVTRPFPPGLDRVP